jgi:hypothetical protein
VHRGASLIAGGKPTWRELLLRMTMPTTAIFGEKSSPDEIRTPASAKHRHQGRIAAANPAGFRPAVQKALS